MKDPIEIVYDSIEQKLGSPEDIAKLIAKGPDTVFGIDIKIPIASSQPSKVQ